MKSKDKSEKLVRKKPKTITLVSAIVVLIVLALNAIFSVIGDNMLFYIDISQTKYKSAKSQMYTLSEDCRKMVEKDVVSMIDRINDERHGEGKEPIAVKIVFCAEKDEIEKNEYTRLVSFTARNMQKEFPEHISVEYVNMTKNPSAVQKYKTTSAATIATSDIIVEFGTEYLVLNVKSFYMTDSDKSSPWAYNGEKRLTAMMLALTRAESPICCITTNHGETLFDEKGNVKEKYTNFIDLIKAAGYEPMFFDLEKEEIPENCRMIITFDPREDFKAFGNLGENNVSEIEKLDKYLDGINSFFYIAGADAAYLPALEEYLEEWGVTVGRYESPDGSKTTLTVEDKVNCADGGKGQTIIGNYATAGLGASFTEDMRERSYPPKVVFGNSGYIVPAENYIKWYVPASEDGSQGEFTYHSYWKNGNSRDMLDIFTTYNTASALANGEVKEVATDIELFRLMTITQETRNVQESNLSTIPQTSYVLAMASTEFLSNDVLSSTAYGNTDVILSVLRNTSNEVIPTDLDLKAIYVYGMNNDMAYLENRPDVWFYCLTFIPIALIFIAGTVVSIRRKYK